jgi:hypothetical protein
VHNKPVTESTTLPEEVGAIFRGVYIDNFLLNALVFQEVKVSVDGLVTALSFVTGLEGAVCIAWVHFSAVK